MESGHFASVYCYSIKDYFQTSCNVGGHFKAGLVFGSRRHALRVSCGGIPDKVSRTFASEQDIKSTPSS